MEEQERHSIKSQRIKYWLMIVACSLLGSIWMGFIFFALVLALLLLVGMGMGTSYSLQALLIIGLMGLLIVLSFLPPFIALKLSHRITKNKGDNILAFIIVLLLEEIWPVYYILISQLA